MGVKQFPDLGRCEAWDHVGEDFVRCGNAGARVLERDEMFRKVRTRIICRDHGFEPDLFSPEQG